MESSTQEYGVVSFIGPWRALKFYLPLDVRWLSKMVGLKFSALLFFLGGRELKVKEQSLSIQIFL